ncbi:MAG: hypothetical protein ACRYG8_54475 [Janthinobacterium lividum]
MPAMATPLPSDIAWRCRRKEGEGYVVDLQAEPPAHLSNRVIVPLLSISELNRGSEIKGKRHGMVTQAPQCRTPALDLLLVAF